MHVCDIPRPNRKQQVLVSTPDAGWEGFYRFADDVLALRRELPCHLRRDLIDYDDGGFSFADKQIGRLFVS